MKLAVVEWHDAACCSSWQDIPDANDSLSPIVCRSIGWVAFQDKNNIVLAGTVGNEGSKAAINQIMTIPVGMVKKITYVGSKHTIKA